MTPNPATMADPAPVTEIEAVQERQPAVPTAIGCLVIVARHHGMHLAAPQLIRDNFLTRDEPSIRQLVKCTEAVGLKAKVVNLKWDGLAQLKKVMPAIVRLTDGTCLVLRRIEGEPEQARVVLQDPNSDDDALLVVDRIRFEEAWTGDVILVKRNYEIAEEERAVQHRAADRGHLPRAVDRARRGDLRDRAGLPRACSDHFLAAVVRQGDVLQDPATRSGSYALRWRPSSRSKRSFPTCGSLLVLHLTSRRRRQACDLYVRKVLNLPIDYFERTPIGVITRDMNEIWRIRNFLIGQLFGTVLDSTMLCWSSCRSCSSSARS